ncbi:DUF3618 domain-containing protein [Agromyces badenianii]|uniref:DUF3618 domain-containing protein n=1 Tax=Agromyces badenianii TaxID=2080742 RepID=UPI000D59A26A|nr:DUF3618 domain-containing protein [Agromyces badenianii]PWC05729.1 hypothetical protein DCE94_05635 [Agromyces badenianii]
MTVVTDATGPSPSKRDSATRERNLTRVQARIASQQARAEFAETLNALEDKLNVPKQVGRRAARAKVKLRRFADEQPAVAFAAAVGLVAAVGATVWLVVRANLD